VFKDGQEGGYKTTPTNTHRYVKQDKIPSNWEPQRMRDVASFPIKLQSYLKHRRKKIYFVHTCVFVFQHQGKGKGHL